MICHFCHNTINGKYYNFESQFQKIHICLHCYQSLPKCKGCNIPINTAREQAAKLCMNCQKNLPKCAICGKNIIGKYAKYANMFVCSTCMRKAPHCEICSRPLKEYITIQGKKLCSECANKIEFCAGCHAPLLGEYFQFKNDSRKFCKKCTNKNNLCNICSMPLGTMFHTLFDERKICNNCFQTAVKTPEQASKILNQILPIIKRKFNIVIPSSTVLHLVDYKTLLKLRHQYKMPGSGDSHALGIFVGQGKLLDVYILDYLPYALCLSTLAHEYTHAWQNRHLRNDTNLLYIEGMAQWVAYHVLLELGFVKEATNITKQDDIYGAGFEKMQKLEKKYGILELCKKLEKKFAISIS